MTTTNETPIPSDRTSGLGECLGHVQFVEAAAEDVIDAIEHLLFRASEAERETTLFDELHKVYIAARMPEIEFNEDKPFAHWNTMVKYGEASFPDEDEFPLDDDDNEEDE